MGSALRTVGNFLTPEDAEIARVALAEEGVTAYLENAATVGMVWSQGNATGWVRLQVAEPDAERARAILDQRSVAGEPFHICQECGVDVPPGFEICWSCQTPLDAHAKESAHPAEDANESEQDAGPESETVSGDRLARRALYTAIFGMFVCFPIFNTYSIWLVLRIAFQGLPLTPKGDRTYRWAIGMNLLVVCLVASLFLTRTLR